MRQLEEFRSYHDHLRAEHRQLHKQLSGLQAELAERATQGERATELLQRLATLREELRRHFAEEEDGGCLEEAISFCPGVSPQADALMHQHGALLKSLDNLVTKLRAVPTGGSLAEVQEEFGKITHELLAHEGAENQVLQRAFGVMVNGEEEE